MSDGASAIALCCCAAALLAAAICVFSHTIGRALGIVDHPDGIRKIHMSDTPLVGGLALAIPGFGVSLVYELMVGGSPLIITALVAGALTFLVGMIDDRFGISPVWRLLAVTYIVFSAFSAEPALLVHALRLVDFGLPGTFQAGIFAAPLTVLIVLGFVNACNMTDGINGQLLGSVMIWCALLARHASGALAVPCLIVIVSALVTIAFNLRGRLFSGSSGAYASSVFIALAAMAVYRQANNTLPASLPLIWFWLPVADCVRLMAERIASGRSPLMSDRNHIHHILLNRMRARYALLLYLFLLGAPAALAEVKPELGVAALFACAAVYVALLVSNVFEKGFGLPQREARTAPVIGFAQSQETGT